MPMKKNLFLQAVVVSVLLFGYTTLTRTKHMEKKLDRNYSTLQNSNCTTTYLPSHKPSK